ncbi:MAG: hypothetical protein LBS02_17905 [Hungatella sp.]|jgi:hypothetical protein|nr:hypothetical protein [Hungatella sp.]
MALINCPECGKEVSNKADVCIHCGCPLDKNVNDTIIETADYFIMDKIERSGLGAFSYKKNWCIMGLAPKCNVLKGDLVDIYDKNKNMLGTYTVDEVKDYEEFNSNEYCKNRRHIIFYNTSDEKLKECAYVVKSGCNLISTEGLYKKYEQTTPKIKCPTCSSIDIKRITASEKVANVALFGLFGNKRRMQFHCNNCKYEW